MGAVKGGRAGYEQRVHILHTLPVTPAKAGAHLLDIPEMGPGLRRGDEIREGA
ncbi:hypothetical protein GCM10011529_21640 [Polymorphobacter glacialis]|uniref:Uncharacterized protein n=1 Tax=Sandarakinorhabdus glacialis TaxID=1614636 RepID=A0A916ZUK2_9SPHN|nr:hypothetical protein GCM10011529_21640 [Polymorphobacter glacialis]